MPPDYSDKKIEISSVCTACICMQKRTRTQVTAMVISRSQTWGDSRPTMASRSSKGSTTDQVMASPTGEQLGNRTVIA